MMNLILNLLRKPPAPAVEMTSDAGDAIVLSARIKVSASVDRVRRMLDPGHAENRWVARGDALDAIDRARGLYRHTDRRLPETPFLVQVEDATQHSIAFVTMGDGGEPIGAFQQSASRYEIAKSPHGAVVALTERPIFLDGLPHALRKTHAKMLAKGLSKDLMRLKAEAERTVA